jgi:hypothetical protein
VADPVTSELTIASSTAQWKVTSLVFAARGAFQ